MIWEKALCNFLLIILNHILQHFLHTPLPLTTTAPPRRSHSFCRLLISSVWRLTVTNRGTPQQYPPTSGGTNYYRLFSSSFQKLWLFMKDCRISKVSLSKIIYVSLWIIHCWNTYCSIFPTLLHIFIIYFVRCFKKMTWHQIKCFLLLFL